MDSRTCQSGNSQGTPGDQAGGSSQLDTPSGSLKTGRNDPCPCGSGKKYKKCCLAKDEELRRQAAAQQAALQQGRIEEASSAGDPLPPCDVEASLDNPSLPEDESRPRTELELRLDRIWDQFEAHVSPTAEQMDGFLAQLLALPPEVTSWSEVFTYIARLKHPDLPGVFRRIAAAVPHTRDSQMAFFYWAAAEEFTRLGALHLLPEVAEGFRRLDLDSYDADALSHLEEMLLVADFEAEALQLLEHFLPIERADDGLMGYAVPQQCNLIFELRVGLALRDASSANASPDALARQLRLNIEEEIDEDSARMAAQIVVVAEPDAAWERAQFDLVKGDIREDETAWRDCLRLFGTLIRVARESWLLESCPPARALRGLSLMLNSVYDWNERPDRKPRKSHKNLLDYLSPDGMESRIARSSRGILGSDAPHARLLLQAHELLFRSAARHQLMAPSACAQTEKELLRLRSILEG